MSVVIATEDISSYTDTTAGMQPDPEARHGSDAVSVSFSQRFPIEDARCATHPVDHEWVPDYERAVVPPALAALCRRCPGRAECLLWALAGDEAGYWAGTTKADRDQLRELGQDSIQAADWTQERIRRRANADAKHPAGEGSVKMYRRKKCRCDECRTANAADRAAERSRAKARAAA